MAVKNASILRSATAAFSAGTALAFVSDGAQVPGGVHIVVPADTDVRTRLHATLSAKPSIAVADGTVSAAKHSVSITQPKLNATTQKVLNNTIRFTATRDALMTDAEWLEVRKIAAQFLLDADFDNFWNLGSTD